MLIGLITEMAVGLICIILGLLIWKKKKVSFIHDYHYRNVNIADIPAYSRIMGIGIILIGVGICVTGLFDFFQSYFWWAPLLIGCVAGFIVMNSAQKKYNGSWFS